MPCDEWALECSRQKDTYGQAIKIAEALFLRFEFSQGFFHEGLLVARNGKFGGGLLAEQV